MADVSQIRRFAHKWLKKYRDPKTLEIDVREGFANECVALSFQLGKDTDNNVEHLKGVKDYQLLGSIIFTKWNAVTRKSTDSQLLEASNRKWFIAALEQLLELASSDYFLSDPNSISKITIITQNASGVQEVEQRLTFSNNGRVWFFGYSQFERRNRKSRVKQTRIDSMAIRSIFGLLARYFEDYRMTSQGKDYWEIIFTDADNNQTSFRGPLDIGVEYDGIDLSDLIRSELQIDGLFVFDGDQKPDRIDKIIVEYHRVSKVISADLEPFMWTYVEWLVIDRLAESLMFIQRIGAGAVVSHNYYIQRDIAQFLDDVYRDSLLVAGNTAHKKDEKSNREYTIKIEYRKQEDKVFTGNFDYHGLPHDWSAFADKVFEFMRFFGVGEMFNPTFYRKKRSEGEYIFCSVVFSEHEKSYYYLSDDDSIEVGDIAVVPVGDEDHFALVKVVKVEYFTKDNAPFDVTKTKTIKRKLSDEELASAKVSL